MATDRSDDRSPDLAAAMTRAELSVKELWTHYFALGGDLGLLEIDAFVHGLADVSSLDHDKLVLVINERFMDLGIQERLPYRASDLNDRET